ncbi:MAG: glycosyltransferase [Candidatus Aminicenantes bacterium]|nr:glycosyltransferase [Candidatus Aminicenantes bacterium]
MLGIILNGLFVFSVIFIWFMLLYQFVLCLGGFLLRQRRHLPAPVDDARLPSVTVLIPARDEGTVIADSISRLRALRYPEGKLEFMIVNDASRDDTLATARRQAGNDPRFTFVDIPAEEGGRGKSAALNRAFRAARGEALAVYDADNLPDAEALRLLAAALVSDRRLAAVTGKFRAYNAGRNLLTRLINLESVAFQWIIQAGRWFFLRISTLPGTNYIIWKRVVESLGGWDEEALTEDAELTFRIYQEGYLVAFLPVAVTWEQEPERLAVWVRQRTRWARGNNYLIGKFSRRLLRRRPNAATFELLNLFYLYYLFVFAILFSDLIFLLSLSGLVHVRLVGPYFELWALAFLLFVLEMMIALSFEREDSPLNLLAALLAYFTYTKLWVFIVLKGLYLDLVRGKERAWAKTERFANRTKQGK